MSDARNAVLVLGASPNPQRYSYKAIEMLSKFNWNIIAYGTKNGSVAGVPITNIWQSNWNIHTITIYLNPSNQEPLYNPILSLHPQRVIFNPGTENPEFESILKKAGIKTERSCTLVLLATNQF
jgi:predicted CoA-binding protein